jgi:hypothetical protein
MPVDVVPLEPAAVAGGAVAARTVASAVKQEYVKTRLRVLCA